MKIIGISLMVFLYACSSGGTSSGSGSQKSALICFNSAQEWRDAHNEAHARLGGCVSANDSACSREMRINGWSIPSTEFHALHDDTIQDCYPDEPYMGSAEGFTHGG